MYNLIIEGNTKIQIRLQYLTFRPKFIIKRKHTQTHKTLTLCNENFEDSNN